MQNTKKNPKNFHNLEKKKNENEKRIVAYFEYKAVENYNNLN